LWLDILGEIFHHRTDTRWVAAAGEERLSRLIEIVVQAGDDQPEAQLGVARLKTEALEALRLLTHRLAALGIDPMLMRYYAPPRELDSPFMAQAAELLAWCQAAQVGAAATVRRRSGHVPARRRAAGPVRPGAAAGPAHGP
jgi:site-specific recombinase